MQARHEEAAETHAAHERAEQHAHRDGRHADDEFEQLKPDDFVDECGAAAARRRAAAAREADATSSNLPEKAWRTPDYPRFPTKRATASDRRPSSEAIARRRTGRQAGYFRCLLTSLVIANMLTDALPPKTAFSLASALIIRLFFLSCRPFFLM